MMYYPLSNEYFILKKYKIIQLKNDIFIMY